MTEQQDGGAEETEVTGALAVCHLSKLGHCKKKYIEKTTSIHYAALLKDILLWAYFL